MLKRLMTNSPWNRQDQIEIRADLRTLEQWLEFRDAHGEVLDHSNFEKWAARIRLNGCVEPLTGWEIKGEEIESSAALREGLVYRGVCSRVRAVMLAIREVIIEQQLQSPAIYAAEAVTAFALRLRGLYPRFVGSEFTLDPTQRRSLYPIAVEDLQALSLNSEAFDIVSTNEVLEHVPSIDAALAEIHRVLQPDGWHIGTVPFNYFSDISQKRAVLDSAGKIKHLLPPEYHGDPMNDKGVLVFEVPGWDLIDRAHAVGFSRAFVRYVASERHGIVAEHVGGVLLFCCQK